MLLLAGLILLAVALVYAPALHGGWIWDDYLYLAGNESLRSLHGLRSIWFSPSGVNYFPVTFTAQWLQWHLWGDATTGYHVCSVLLHGGNSYLLFRLLRRLAVPGAALAGVLFAVHPLAVETVAWVSEFKTVLSLTLLLASARCTCEADTSRSAYLASVACFVGAMLAKSTVVAFPILFLGYAWWRQRRLRRGDLLRSLPFFAFGIALGLVTIWFERHRAMAPLGVSAAGPLTRLARAGEAVAFYTAKSLVPWPLHPGYSAGSVFQAAVLGVLLITAIASLAWSRRGFRFGLGAFGVSLLPILGLIPMAYARLSPVADHFAYTALPWIIATAAAGLASLSGPARLLRPAAGLLVVALAALSRSDAARFSGEEAYWHAVLGGDPGSWLARNHLGALRLRERRIDEATELFREAVAANPTYVEAHANLGLALEASGRFDPAQAEFQAALRLRPGDRAATHDLAALHLQQGDDALRDRRFDAAAIEFRQALAVTPDNPTAENNLGIAASHLGRLAEAADHYRAALRLRPDYAGAHVNLANCLVRLGRAREAIPHYEAALRIDPNNEIARSNLRLARLQADFAPILSPP